MQRHFKSLTPLWCYGVSALPQRQAYLCVSLHASHSESFRAVKFDPLPRPVPEDCRRERQGHATSPLPPITNTNDVIVI